MKTLIRSSIFDAHERRHLDRMLRKRGSSLKIYDERFLVGDAAKHQFPANSYDFIYSDDVFEHIPATDLDLLCKNLSSTLSTNGTALITPSIFTGISGGHLVEWYPHTLPRKNSRPSEPWEHLRKRRYVPDCFLNEHWTFVLRKKK